MDLNYLVRKLQIGAMFLCLCFIIGSCKEQTKEAAPQNLVAKDTMVKILTEFHLLESSMGIRIFDDKQIVNTRNAVKYKIYEQFGVSKNRFLTSYNYYAKFPSAIDSLYIEVISELTKQQAQQLK